MKQKVKTVSYLAKAEFEIKNGVYDVVALPIGAEVIQCHLEIIGTPTAGTINVGFKDESHKNYFLADVNANTTKYSTSAKCYTSLDTKIVVAEVKSANAQDCKGVLRVLYFLPSEMEVEY
ncbi:hypothetical protein [Helicobacter cetorum]|uniref:hypothetical protein n=1 Tax=Helicobacter cetorum TaxID=138563 RepID=UPI000CF09E35|nr:hypothetical protein [Helicobacter cetorum]